MRWWQWKWSTELYCMGAYLPLRGLLHFFALQHISEPDLASTYLLRHVHPRCLPPLPLDSSVFLFPLSRHTRSGRRGILILPKNLQLLGVEA